jgi:hypothetical protein
LKFAVTFASTERSLGDDDRKQHGATAVTPYAVAISIHVVTAILGLGQVAAIAVVAGSAAVMSADSPSWTALQRLVVGARSSLVVILLSGAFIEYVSGGAFHAAWWFRLSFFGLLALGACTGAVGRTLRRRAALGNERARQRVVLIAWVMCALTASIAVLMELKPW